MTQSIQNFWQLGWSIGTKLPGCWQLKNKNSLTTIYNHLLFDVQTAYSSMKARENLLGSMNKETCPTHQPYRTLWTQTSDWLLFSKFADFYISKFRISVGWCYLAKLLCHFSCVPNSLFSFPQSNLWQDMNPFCFHLASCPMFAAACAWPF